MGDRLLPALITLIAGAITCIIDIYRKAELLSSLKRLLLVLIVFYIIGLIARGVIRKTLEPKRTTEDHEADSEAEDELNEKAEDNKEDNEGNSENS